ncbi:hypothetical protein ES332_D12G094700v1 [Gossypium tomentosum]|uniref:Uncharacterized protein n=1 Tax=Gossypium tomentosum TaxID=34277 RepID=A0A5D2I792_GOSTO|nr:hypothetical protein ES332_D12G094700v1 [Gossypium tomentosum]
MFGVVSFTLPVLPSRLASSLRLLFLPSTFCPFAQSLFLFFFSLSLFRLAFSTSRPFSFLFLSVTLSIALNWWVSRLLLLKGKGYCLVSALTSSSIIAVLT